MGTTPQPSASATDRASSGAVPLHYRPDIDGLRAIAVLAVMIYHAVPAWLPGGYAGVDVFFVISGYLITRTILDDRAAGRFSLLRFWERRARRILPLLFTVLAVTAIPATLWMTPVELKGFGVSLGASTIFAANLYFWRSSGGYFALDTDQLPLLHLWSLGVEEQFYLIWPILCLIAFRWRPALLLPVALAGLAASLALAEWWSIARPVANFFLLPTRFWELLAGCTLALWSARRGAKSATASDWADAATLMGLAAIVASFALLDDADRFPGLLAVPVIAGATLVIATAHRARLAGALLRWRPMVGIGLISYGAYLWHHPLLALVRVIMPNALRPLDAMALLGVAMLLAWASWRWIERPTRDRARTPSLTLMLALGGAALLLLGYAAIMRFTQGLPARLPPAWQRIAAMSEVYPARMDPCFFPADGARATSSACLVGEGGPVRTIILGDSHAAAIAPGLEPTLAASGTRAALYVAAGCPITDDPTTVSALQRHCPALIARLRDAAAADPDVRLIVLAARWPYYVERKFYDNGAGGVERGPVDDFASTSERTDRLGRSFQSNVRRLLAAGKTVLIVRPVPEPGWNVPKLMVHGWLRDGTLAAPTTNFTRWRQRSARADAMLAKAAAPGVIFADPAAAICTANRCQLTAAGQPFYFDDDHPSRRGARMMLERGIHPADRRAVLELLRK